jgi:hypothetical protein
MSRHLLGHHQVSVSFKVLKLYLIRINIMGCLSFTNTAGSRQPSHSRARVPYYSWACFTVSDSRLPQPGGAGPRIYISQKQGSPVLPPDTGFFFIDSYDSQGYGAGIWTHLHAGAPSLCPNTEHRSHNSCVVAWSHYGRGPAETPFPAILPLVTLRGFTYSTVTSLFIVP